MNKRIFYTGGCLLSALFALSSCEQEIDSFSEQSNFVYFDLPYVLNEYLVETSNREEGYTYSFEMDDETVTSYTFKVPVNAISLPANRDRNYKVQVIAGETTATNEEWDPSCIENNTIKAGELTDTLYIEVQRSQSLRSEWKTISLQIVPNEEFGVGYSNLLTVKLSFSDQVEMPEWWPQWQSYLGEYCREKFVKWREIYYLGADPNKEHISYAPTYGKPLWWDNMPYLAAYASSYYPTTMMFINVLKQYFIDNEVYPDGDTSQPRISLP